MNDADRKAYSDAFWKYADENICREKDFEAGWRAACEWRDSQVVEPRYWVHNFGSEDGGEEFFNHPTGSDCLDCVPLYLVPPAAQINQQLMDVLEQAMWVIDSMEQNYGNLWQVDETPESLDALLLKIRAALAAAKETK